MTIVIELPDEVATRIAATGEDVQRFTLRAALAQLQWQEAAPDAHSDMTGGSLYDDLLPFIGKVKGDGKAWSEGEGPSFETNRHDPLGERRGMGKGQTVAELAASLSGQPTETLADALRGRVGQFHSGKGDLSQRTGERFAALLAAERKNGKP